MIPGGIKPLALTDSPPAGTSSGAGGAGTEAGGAAAQPVQTLPPVAVQDPAATETKKPTFGIDGYWGIPNVSENDGGFTHCIPGKSALIVANRSGALLIDPEHKNPYVKQIFAGETTKKDVESWLKPAGFRLPTAVQVESAVTGMKVGGDYLICHKSQASEETVDPLGYYWGVMKKTDVPGAPARAASSLSAEELLRVLKTDAGKLAYFNLLDKQLAPHFFDPFQMDAEEMRAVIIAMPSIMTGNNFGIDEASCSTSKVELPPIRDPESGQMKTQSICPRNGYRFRYLENGAFLEAAIAALEGKSGTRPAELVYPNWGFLENRDGTFTPQGRRAELIAHLRRALDKTNEDRLRTGGRPCIEGPKFYECLAIENVITPDPQQGLLYPGSGVKMTSADFTAVASALRLQQDNFKRVLGARGYDPDPSYEYSYVYKKDVGQCDRLRDILFDLTGEDPNEELEEVGIIDGARSMLPSLSENAATKHLPDFVRGKKEPEKREPVKIDSPGFEVGGKKRDALINYLKPLYKELKKQKDSPDKYEKQSDEQSFWGKWGTIIQIGLGIVGVALTGYFIHTIKKSTNSDENTGVDGSKTSFKDDLSTDHKAAAIDELEKSHLARKALQQELSELEKQPAGAERDAKIAEIKTKLSRQSGKVGFKNPIRDTSGKIEAISKVAFSGQAKRDNIAEVGPSDTGKSAAYIGYSQATALAEFQAKHPELTPADYMDDLPQLPEEYRPRAAKMIIRELDMEAYQDAGAVWKDKDKKMKLKLKKQVAEWVKKGYEVFIFIDEAHQSDEGSETILKQRTSSMLEQFKVIMQMKGVHFVLASTVDELRATLSDPAKANRLGPVIFGFQTPEEGVRILRGMYSRLEESGVERVEDSALKAIYVLSKKTHPRPSPFASAELLFIDVLAEMKKKGEHELTYQKVMEFYQTNFAAKKGAHGITPGNLDGKFERMNAAVVKLNLTIETEVETIMSPDLATQFKGGKGGGASFDWGDDEPEERYVDSPDGKADIAPPGSSAGIGDVQNSESLGYIKQWLKVDGTYGPIVRMRNEAFSDAVAQALLDKWSRLDGDAQIAESLRGENMDGLPIPRLWALENAKDVLVIAIAATKAPAAVIEPPALPVKEAPAATAPSDSIDPPLDSKPGEAIDVRAQLTGQAWFDKRMPEHKDKIIRYFEVALRNPALREQCLEGGRLSKRGIKLIVDNLNTSRARSVALEMAGAKKLDRGVEMGGKAKESAKLGGVEGK